MHKILIVDDERINLALVKFGLSEQRYKVFEANDGDVALEVVKAENPDLIILDVQMPRMNGLEFMNELKMLQGLDTIPVIMLTANETMQDIFTLEGVRGYFVKPVDLPSLLAKVKEILGDDPD
ncbi:MAG: response regulator [Candidatus Omnitrophica bacterium]|nr:response regulator [Candidatus Omnitrophota bacterium]MCB9747809.1 response regulator [Candidatus Omnitrophota bacterium]